MVSETTGVGEEPQVSYPTTDSVSSGQEALYSSDQVRYFASLEAGKVQGAKDREIAEMTKSINLGHWAGKELAEARDELRQLKEAEVLRLENLARGNTEALDVVKLKREVVAAAAEVTKAKQLVDLENLELLGFKESKAKQERYNQVKELAVEFELSDEQVEKLCEQGGSVEQIRFYAKEFGRVNTGQRIPTPAPASGVAGGSDLSWEATKKAFAEGKVSQETYAKAREAHFKK